MYGMSAKRFTFEDGDLKTPEGQAKQSWKRSNLTTFGILLNVDTVETSVAGT